MEQRHALALQIVNDVRAAFGKPTIAAFTPAYTDEDTDCVLQELKDATGLSLEWGEFDGERHWLSIWGGNASTAEKLAAAWSSWLSDWRKWPDEAGFEVVLPTPLAEFAAAVALGGEYPELVREVI